MKMVASDELLPALQQALAFGRRVAVLAFSAAAVERKDVVWRKADGNATRYAHDLYATLRDFDHQRCDLILLEAIPDAAPWAAVADRLRRATRGSGPA